MGENRYLVNFTFHCPDKDETVIINNSIEPSLFLHGYMSLLIFDVQIDLDQLVLLA